MWATMTALLMLAVLSIPISAFGATSLMAGRVRGTPGTTVAIPVSLGSAGNVVALQADIAFDATVFTFDSVTAGAAGTNHTVRSSEPSPGVRRLLLYSPTNRVLSDGALVNLQFLVRSNAAEGVYPLSLTNVILADASAASVLPLQLTNGAITVAYEMNCVFMLSSASASFPASGGASNVAVMAPDTCAWSAVNTNGWISITSGSNGFGNGVVNYTIAANVSSLARTGTLVVAGQSFAVRQGGAPCVYVLSRGYASFVTAGGSNTVLVAAPQGCSWAVFNTNSWITVLSGSNGAGNGTVRYAVAKNIKARTRTGTLLIAGQPYLVVQSDTTKPTVAIVLPTTKTKVFTNASVLPQGTAKDNVGVARVEYALNSKTNYLTAIGTTNWMAVLTLTNGNNTLRVRSIDLAGNVSAVVTRVWRYKPPVSHAASSTLARVPDGEWHFSFTTVPGSTYVLQSSTNLQEWTVVSTNAANTTSLSFTNRIDRAIPHQFFRLKRAQ